MTSLVPAGFEAYVRVLFPFRGPRDVPVPWREVAAHAGRELSASTSSEELWESLSPARWRQLDISLPLSGDTPVDVAEALVDVLAGATSTPLRCFFAVWDGKGGLAPHHMTGEPVETPARTWFLHVATVADAVQGFDMTVGVQTIPPHLWWPADHAWFVGAELDCCAIYLGCDRETANAVLASGLEAFAVSPTDPLLP